MDPRGKSGKASKALAPGARRLGSAPESDNESLPSAPSLGCPSVSPKRGDSKRRVVVAEPRAILRPQQPEERARLTPNALVLRSHAEVKDRKKDSEPRKPRNQGKVKSDKPAKVEKVNKRRLDEEQAPRKKQKAAEQKAKPEKNEKVPAEREPGPKVVEQAAKDNGDEKKKKKEKKKKIRKEPSDAAEPSDAEVQEPSPKRVEKGKKHKEKKADKADKANKDEKKRNKEKDKASRHPEAKDDEKVVPSKRQKEKKSKQPEPEQRSKSEDPPVRQTADEPPEEASSPRRGRRRDRRARHAKEVEDTKPQVERAQTETRDRRRRRERSERSESRSRHKRRPQVLPPDAWQVWHAGSYHPWSSQLAGAPFGVWPMAMQSMQPMGTDGLSQAWMGNLPSVDPRRAPSPGSLEVESSESEAPESQDEEDVEVEQPVVAEMPATEAIPQIAVLDDGDADGDANGSVTSRTSEGEESETESQDEDAEIGEAPVARRPVIELELADDIDIDMPKVQWQPPGPERLREPLHHSMERWLGPKVGWMELYQLDLDMAVQMKPSVQRIREGDGKGIVDPDGEIEGAIFEANPSEAPQEGVTEGPAVPLLIPRWSGTRSWSSPVQVTVDDSSCWQKRRLSSVVLRSRRTGRSAAGGGGGANPQDPETEPSHSEGSTILIFLGAVARSVRMVQWRTPPILVLPEDLKVDPTKYRGAERAIRMKRRPTKTVAQKKAAKKSAAGPPPKAGESVDEYEAKLKVLMQQLQDPSAAAHAVSTFWNSLSPANRVQFEKDFPQFMNMVGPGVQSKAVPPMHAHILPGQPNMMYLPVPPPPKSAGLGVSALHAMPSLPTLAPSLVSPAPWPKATLAPEIIKQQEAAWASRLTFHDGILRADMSSLQLGDAGLARWCQWAPSLLKTLGSAGGAPLSNADLNFSGNAIEDAGLRSLLELLRSCDVHVRSLNLNVNRLTEASLVTISDLIAESRLAVSDVHMKNNRMQGSYGLMHLTRAIKDNDKYPMFLSEKQRYTPLMLHLAGNMIERPMQVTQLVKEALDNKFPPLSEERQYWESKMQCPPLQLPCFDKQETREIAMFQ